MYLARIPFWVQNCGTDFAMFHVSISEFICGAHANPNNDIVIRTTCRVSGMSDLVLNCTPRGRRTGSERREPLYAFSLPSRKRKSSPFPANFRSRRDWVRFFRAGARFNKFDVSKGAADFNFRDAITRHYGK